MFWADRIAKEIQETKAAKEATADNPLIIRDEKTLSGRVHIGSMRGVAIHGLESELLASYGIPNTYFYELNDFDDFDTVPGYLDQEKFKEHLGKPLHKVPSPEAGFDNYAEYFGAEFVAVHQKAGFTPMYYRTHKDLYAAGKMDECIRLALTKAADVRRIYKEVSGSVKAEGWLPVTVICESCGKIRTTSTSDFDGETVAYACNQNPDDTRSCGHAGRIAPWKGNAKLHWKVDWAAKWVAMQVNVEGGGKDHSTKGGSRDVANHIAREIFNYEPPFDIPYEFFLVGGKKMSSSKGRGSSAHDMSELFPPALFRFLLISKEYGQQIDVDPEGDSVPRLYDAYDDCAEKVRQGVADDFTRMYELSQLPENQADAGAPWQMRFSQVAFIVQMPHLTLATEAVLVKGSALSEEELALLEERAHYAKFWLGAYAPERYKYELQNTLPEGLEFSDTQKKAISLLRAFVETGTHSGDEFHARLHELKTEVPIEPKELFTAIYRLFLNRDSGPKAGWFLSVLPQEFLLARLTEVQ